MGVVNEMLSASEMTDAVGCSYRQLDYWIRHRVLEPAVGAAGTGSGRRFDAGQVRVVRLVAALASLGAKSGVLARAAAAAERLPPNEWFGTAYVDRRGELSRHPRSASWALDLSDCAAPPRQLALV